MLDNIFSRAFKKNRVLFTTLPQATKVIVALAKHNG